MRGVAATNGGSQQRPLQEYKDYGRPSAEAIVIWRKLANAQHK